MSGARGWLWVIPAALLVTGLLTVVVSGTRSDGIEADLTSRSQAALAAAGLPGGRVSFDGRDAQLTDFPAGTAERAADAVRQVDGVRQVQVSDIVPAPATKPNPPAPTSTKPPAPPSTTEAPPPTDKAGLQKEIDKIVEDQPIMFEPDSNDLTDTGRQTVQRVADLIVKADLNPRIEIDGYVAEGPGSARNALRLSRERALAVKGLLAESGVSTRRITSRGFGDEGSTGDETVDRRVELTIG